MIKLRDYQLALKTGLYNSWNNGNNNVILVSPTGSGKTVVMASIAADQSTPGVAIAHRVELVGQISQVMAVMGIEHNIIGPTNTVTFCIRQQIAELGRKYYNPNARVTVAAVDALKARAGKLSQWCAQQTWWMVDECFVAGTLISTPNGDVPIETLRVGDTVMAFDERSGEFKPRRVRRLFKNPVPNQMIRVVSSHHVLYTTKGHPFWTRRGWVCAGDLRHGDDVLHVWRQRSAITKPHGPLSEKRSSILQQTMLGQVSLADIIADYGKNEPKIRIGTNDRTQPDGTTRNTQESFGSFARDRSQAEGSRRKRDATDRGRVDVEFNAQTSRVSESICSENRMGQVSWSGSLQDRLCKPSFENSNRSGRHEPCVIGPTSIGSSQGCFSAWQRVDGVKILERDDPEIPGDGHVYNIEVDEHHTYVANGIVVHNCHHVLTGNKWGNAVTLFPRARGVGVTATPVRADRKSLHVSQGGVFHDMVLGPSMRELINRGSLCDYRIFAPPQSIDVTGLKIGSTGDYSQPGLRDAAHHSQIVGDVVSHYLRFAEGLRGITFVVDVEQAVEMAEAFNNAGVPAMAVSAKTPDVVRAEAVRKLRDGKVLQLVNVDLFGEGFDVPAVECVSMARPTMSYGLYVQQFGRALRPLEGKSHGIIIDHVGNVKQHGLPDAPRNWTLYQEERGKRLKRDEKITPVTACLSCFRAYEAVLSACPHCGYKPEPQGRRKPEQVAGDLVELDPMVLAMMRGEADRIMGEAQIPHGASEVIVRSVKKQWARRQEAQKELRRRMAIWGGVQRDRGDTDSMMQRRFFYRFGIDVMSAQALAATEAEALSDEIAIDWLDNEG